jgi:hypothetical protein
MVFKNLSSAAILRCDHGRHDVAAPANASFLAGERRDFAIGMKIKLLVGI